VDRPRRAVSSSHYIDARCSDSVQAKTFRPSVFLRFPVTRWLARGDAIGVFRNADLGHPDIGRAVFIPIAPNEREKLPIGKARAPDGAHGLGWRFLLESVRETIDGFDFVDLIPDDEPLAKPKRKRRKPPIP
jgi:hypothetical protein